MTPYCGVAFWWCENGTFFNSALTPREFERSDRPKSGCSAAMRSHEGPCPSQALRDGTSSADGRRRRHSHFALFRPSTNVRSTLDKVDSRLWDVDMSVHVRSGAYADSRRASGGDGREISADLRSRRSFASASGCDTVACCCIPRQSPIPCTKEGVAPCPWRVREVRLRPSSHSSSLPRVRHSAKC
jgi:hypothetical protein